MKHVAGGTFISELWEIACQSIVASLFFAPCEDVIAGEISGFCFYSMVWHTA